MFLREVVGQRAAKEGLLRMYHNNQLPHALLFAGSAGTGGLPLAVAFARFVFCENKQKDDSCGLCPNCRKIRKLEHADLHLTFPAVPPKSGTKALSAYYQKNFREFFRQTPYSSAYDWFQFIEAENKQGNIPAEECQQIIERLSLKSYEGNKKIQIIWRPEYLGKEGNILLKLIEEPPADTYLFLVAENPEDILATVLSRLQTIRLSPVSAEDIIKGLVERNLTSPENAAQVARISNGSFAEALKLLKDSDSSLFADMRRWFNALFTHNGVEVSRCTEDMSKLGREQQKNFLAYVVRMLEQTIRARYLPDAVLSLPAEEAAFVKKLASQPVSFEMISEIIKNTARTSYYIERNTHARTQLHALSIRIMQILQDREPAWLKL